MRYYIRYFSYLCMMLILGLVLTSCSRPKEGKVEVGEHEFAVRKLSPFAYTIDAKGKIKNVGGADVKKIIVTGKCRSCTNGLAPGRWTIADDRDRTAEEKCMINYLVAGGEAEFSFTDVAVMYNTIPDDPKGMPDQMEIVIVSFETVN
jgi:hypothetical protein